MKILKEIPYYRLCSLTEWRIVKENSRYAVSCDGEVLCWSWHRTGKPRICKLSEVTNGYLKVGIDGVLKFVHRIVAEAFISNPEGKPCIDHINTVRTDNRVENMRWVTQRENCNNNLTLEHHALRGKFGADCPNSIPIVQLDLNGKFIKKWSAAMEVQREFGINQGNITSCCRGRYKSAGGYRWMYYSDWNKQKKTVADIKPLFD